MIFHGLDTETDNNPDGGEAVLITVAGETSGTVRGPLVLPKSFDEIFKFLARDKGRRYVAFNADFDIQALLHDNFLPYPKLQKLARFKYMEHKGYHFKYVPSKFCFVSKKDCSFTVYDLQQFFGGTLAQAAKKHLGIEKLEIPKEWYPRMKKILQRPRNMAYSTILKYAQRDADIAFQLGEKLVASYTTAGIVPTRLISPASMAVQYFKKDLEKEKKPPLYVNTLWQKGFYGGRVEIGGMGKFENVSLYDIRSAYPAEIAKLVSLDGATMHNGEGWKGWNLGADYGLYHLTAYVPLSWHWGPLAVRDKGKVIFPVGAVKTWCCLPALKMLNSLNVRYEIHKWWEWSGSSGRPIFTGINKLYLSRQDPVLALASKLSLNSLYGKLCENTTVRFEHGFYNYRSKDFFGPYTNYILASHITESVRMKVFASAKKSDVGAYMMATDSILVNTSRFDEPAPIGQNLGDWDIKGHYKSATILGCGRYFLEHPDGKIEGFMRGFPAAQHYDKLRTCKSRSATIKSLENLSMLMWANGAAGGDLNVLKVTGKNIRLDDDKRYWLERPKRICDAFTQNYRSQPWIVGKKKELEKMIGR